MVHGVEELVFVDEPADEKIDEAKKEHEEGARKYAVDGADDEDEDGLWKEKPIGEDRGLHEFGVVSRSFGTDEEYGV